MGNLEEFFPYPDSVPSAFPLLPFHPHPLSTSRVHKTARAFSLEFPQQIPMSVLIHLIVSKCAISSTRANGVGGAGVSSGFSLLIIPPQQVIKGLTLLNFLLVTSISYSDT